MKKKKGFTLVELVCAVAIIAICIPFITDGFSKAFGYMYETNARLDTMTMSQSIVQVLKAQGRDTAENYLLNAAYNNDTSTNISKVYIYFNDYDDIKKLLSKSAPLSNFITSNEIYRLTNSSIPGYDEARSHNIDKQFCAYLIISNDQTPSDTGGNTGNFQYSKVYKIDITVWDVKSSRVVDGSVKENLDNSSTTTYIGG